MRFRVALATTAVGAALIVGSLVPTATAQSSSAAASWHYTGETWGTRGLCEDRGRWYTANYMWPYQCRGPHTDGLFYLYVYF